MNIVGILKRINKWFRDMVFDDVDKEYDVLPYHRGFGSKKNPTERIEKRFKEQKKQNRLN